MSERERWAARQGWGQALQIFEQAYKQALKDKRPVDPLKLARVLREGDYA